MKKGVLLSLFCVGLINAAANQTLELTAVQQNGKLPFKLCIEVMDLKIPSGIQSMAVGHDGSDYLFIAGRTNGLHGFANSGDFPPSKQNTTVFVVNPKEKRTYSRSLFDNSGLQQSHIDTLSVVSPQSYQAGKTLYITGGYGFDTATQTFTTKDTLTAINVPGLINWVKNCNSSRQACDFIRQITNPVFQVTGGEMYQYGNCPTLLIFGQNFIGNYNTSSNGIYTKQVRRFHIIDDGKCLDVKVLKADDQQDFFRRRDLNVIPIIKTDGCKKTPAYVALSGVFTLATGIWTVPVEITSDGTATMADPDLESTFKQAMNNYNSAHAEILAPCGDMYSILFGGLTFGFFEDGEFMTDPGIPFTNQITAVKRSSCGSYEQILLPIEYPTLLSTQSNPGNTLLFGTGARFAFDPDAPIFSNGVLNLKKVKCKTVIGYIFGGIQSTLPDTNTQSDSAASPHIFKVSLKP